MKKFKYPLAISGTKEQVESIIPRLIELGYSWFSGQKQTYTDKCGYYLLTDFGPLNGTLGYIDASRDQTHVSANNPELVLALAACVEGSQFHIGEWIKFETWPEKACKLKKIIGFSEDGYNWLRLEGEFMSSKDSDKYNHYNPHPNFVTKATKEEIIEHFKPKTMEKKIIAYKSKPGLFQAAKNALKVQSGIFNTEVHFNAKCEWAAEAKELNILDLMFDPIYEEEKKVITLQSDQGTFQIEVSKNGIYYAPEKHYLYASDIEKAITDPLECKIGIVDKIGNSYIFKRVFTHIDSGCKKNVPIADWKKVLEVYEQFKK